MCEVEEEGDNMDLEEEYEIGIVEGEKEQTKEGNWKEMIAEINAVQSKVEQEEAEQYSDNGDNDDEDWLPPAPKKQKKEEKGFMQAAVNNPEFSAVCILRGQTPGDVSAAAANFANNEKNKGISRSNIHEKHLKHSKIVATSIRDKVRQNLSGEHCSIFVQWDEKLLPNYADGDPLEEGNEYEPNVVGRMLILATSPKGTHLLGIPKILDGK